MEKVQQLLAQQQHLRLISDSISESQRLIDILISASLTGTDSSGRVAAVKYVQQNGQLKSLKPVTSVKQKLQKQFLDCESTYNLFRKLIDIIGFEFIQDYKESIEIDEALDQQLCIKGKQPRTGEQIPVAKATVSSSSSSTADSVFADSSDSENSYPSEPPSPQHGPPPSTSSSSAQGVPAPHDDQPASKWAQLPEGYRASIKAQFHYFKDTQGDQIPELQELIAAKSKQDDEELQRALAEVDHYKNQYQSSQSQLDSCNKKYTALFEAHGALQLDYTSLATQQLRIQDAVSAHKGPASPAGKAAFGFAQKRRREEVSPIKVE